MDVYSRVGIATVVKSSAGSEVIAVMNDFPGVLFDFSLILAIITARLSSND